MKIFTVILQGFMFLFKSIFGTKKPLKTTVEHPDKEVKIDDGKTDEERLEDLGL